MKAGALFTIPNTLSLSRLFLALAFVLVSGRNARLWIVIAAALTDFLDGYLARRSRPTVAGAIIDPVADRAFVLTAVTVYLISGWISGLQYVVFLLRDFATAVGFVVSRFIPDVPVAAFRARLAGKTVTVMQLIALVAVLVIPDAVQPLIVAIGIVSVISIVDYTIALSRARA